MRVSAATDYALRALVRLAADETDRPVPSQSLASAEGIPHPYLLAILGRLGRHGIVHSRRGRDGGFALAVPASAIRVSAVVTAMGEPEAPTDDGPLSVLWQAAGAGYLRVLNDILLADLVAGRLPEAISCLPSAE